MSIKFVETSNDGDRDWGAHVKNSNKVLDKKRYKVHNITVVRIAEFINKVVGTRKITNARGAAVMKLDVEVRIQARCLTDRILRGWSWKS